MSDFLGWRFFRFAADTTAERLDQKREIEGKNGPDTSELIWAADENSPDFGLRIVRPRTREDYYYEGMLQNNCISGLQIDAYNNYPVVYSVRDENNLPLVSYEARYVPLTKWQADPYERDSFFQHREHENAEDHHVWKGPQDGLGVLMTRQVCSVGNHVPGEDKLMKFIKANIEHMKQRGLSYMQYITAEGEHQPGTCQEGCPTQERESLVTNPLLSLADLEAIVDSKDRKPAAGAKLYLQAPFYAVDKNGEIDADKHRGDLSILPIGEAFRKKAQAEDEGEVVNIEGREVRVPRDYMVVPVPFSERTIRQGDKIHDMLLSRNGGGGMSIAPNARFQVKDKDIVHRRLPVALAVTYGSLSRGLNTVSTNKGDHCATCLPKDEQYLQVETGKFVYDDELEENRDKILVPITEDDVHKFRKNDQEMEFNELEHSYVPVSKLMSANGLPEHFTHIEDGVAKSHDAIKDNPTGFSIYPYDIKSSVSDDEKKRIADSTYGIFANPKDFAPHLGQFGKPDSVLIVDGPDTINHHGKKRSGLQGVPWLVKAGSDAFHHVKQEEHIPNGSKYRDGTDLPEEHRCGVTGENGVEGSCGQPHALFSLAKPVNICSDHRNGECQFSSGLSLRDLIYAGVDHDYTPGRKGECATCGTPKSMTDDKGNEVQIHAEPVRMQEPHLLWDSEQQKWKPNLDENGRNIGGTERILQYGQDMGAPDFHLVADADSHFASITAPQSEEHGFYLPSNVSPYHPNPNRAAYISRSSSYGIPLSSFLDNSKVVSPGPLYDTLYPLTAKKNADLFAQSTNENDENVYINPEKIDVKVQDGKPAYTLKSETRSPLVAPSIYYRGSIADYAAAGSNAFSDDGSPSSHILRWSTTPFVSSVDDPSEVGELSTYKLNTPEFVCRSCGNKAELENPEEGKEDKNTYKVICPEHSKQFLQCPGGKNHRMPIRVKQDDEGTSLSIAAAGDDDKIEYLGQDTDGSLRIHCRVCKDRCGTCGETGFQGALFTERGKPNVRDPRLCPSCEGLGSIDSQEQKGTIVREPVAGQRRGTVGLLTPDNIVLTGGGNVELRGHNYTELDKNGVEETKYMKVPNSSLIAEGGGAGLSRGKAERMRNAMYRMFRTVSFVKHAAESDPRLPKLQKIMTEEHAPCGASGIFCDGKPHQGKVKERELWRSPDENWSIQHLLNSDAFFKETALQTHCLAYNYQSPVGDGSFSGRDPNPISLRDKDNVPIVTGDFRVVSKEDFDRGQTTPYGRVRGVEWTGYGQEDWREEDPERPIPLPDGSAHLIDPLFSNDTWSKEIIDPSSGERKSHPSKGVLVSSQIVKQRDQIPENKEWLPFLTGIHSIMKDRGIDYFNYIPYGQSTSNLLTRDQIGDIITRFNMGDRLKDKKVYLQLPVGNWDPRNPDTVIPDQNSKILPIGEAFNEVA